MTDKYGRKHTDGSRSGGQPVDDSIKEKALALLNETIKAKGCPVFDQEETMRIYDITFPAIVAAIEAHEAFKQEVSDVVYRSLMSIAKNCVADAAGDLSRFIIPKPKPDPLVEAVHEVDTGPEWDSPEDYCNKIRAALEARGLEIREKG